ITIAVESGIITGETIPNDKFYKPGEIMYDFEIQRAYTYDETALTMTPKKVTLSELFEGKKAVVINFFFTNCDPCNKEIPAMAKVYEEMKNDVAIIGLTNDPRDSDDVVAGFVAGYKATYPMAFDTVNLTNKFTPAITAFPTSVMIDRYGVVCERIQGGESDPDFWRAWLSKYIAEDYSPSPLPEDPNTSFIPDKPADYDEFFSPDGMDRINNTGVPVTFSGATDETVWPWKLDDDGESIVTSNKGHYLTRALLYVRVNIPQGKVLAFDYKISGLYDYDYFYIAVDPNGGMGTQTFEETGDKDWRTGYAYVPLESGEHDIAFAYYKTSSDSNIGNLADTVKIKNLRFVDAQEFLANSEPMDIPYYAARGITETGGIAHYETVELGNDGFYHVQGRDSSQGDAPIMYMDMLDAVPFFTDPEHTATIYTEYLAKSNYVFNGIDYRNKLTSYGDFAGNASLKGLIPVNEDIKDMLTNIYLDVIGKEIGHEEFWSPENGWQEFCVFYVHYGKGDSYGNTIEGLAPFTAHKAIETTDLPNDSDKINTVTFDRVLVPRGQMFEFVPDKSGVYEISGVNRIDKNGKVEVLGKDAWLFDGDGFEDEYTSYLQANAINSCGSDYYLRNQAEGFDFENVNFKMIHYLEAGHPYYVLVAFSVVENLSDLKFRIDYLDTEHYEYLTSATAGTLVPGEGNVYIRPIYTQIEKNSDGIYVDTILKKPIYCDFTDLSRMFNRYSIGNLIGKIGTAPFPNKKPFDFTNAEITSVYGETFEKKDYTETMKAYYDKSIKDKKVTDELYGLVEVDDTLRAILILFYANNVGFDNKNEWLTACWYYDFADATKPEPDTILYAKGKQQ
ncbi:MAG: TlpA family protein disulfide reductase, partial [Clostridia bacterium]|nr:TlpA family protein disulfide reductase [Clostridia bacterium]